MARQAVLAELTRRLDAASAAADWVALATVVCDIAEALPTLAESGPWRDAERVALGQLRARHAAARKECDRALAELGVQMATMRGQQQGWRAYAETEAWYDAGKGAL